jgi:1-phosphofructokinase family hexose kinase
MILTVTLNPAIDKTVKVSNFKLGEDFREEEINLSAGGKGLNVSRVIKTLGGQTIATGFLGGMAGNFIKTRLSQEKIRSAFSYISDETRTNLTIINPKNGQITRVLERGPLVKAKEIVDFKKKYSSLLPKCSYVIFSGSLPRGVSPSLYGELIKIANRKGIKTVLDTSGQPLLLGFKAIPFMLKPNLKEAEQILGDKLTTLSAIKKGLNYFLSKGIKIVVITLGKKGALGSDGKEIWRAIPPSVKPKNNVGCGDALIGGFLFSLSRGEDFKEAFHLGVASGTANTLSINPGVCRKEDIMKLSHRVKLEKLK